MAYSLFDLAMTPWSGELFASGPRPILYNLLSQNALQSAILKTVVLEVRAKLGGTAMQPGSSVEEEVKIERHGLRYRGSTMDL